MNFLLHLLGASPDRSAILTRVALVFHAGLGSGVALLLAVAVAAWVIWAYRQGDDTLRRWQRFLLSGLRVFFLWLVLLVVLRPSLSLTLESKVRRTLLVLFDTSASMGIADVQERPRLARVQQLLQEPKLSLLSSLGRDYDLAAFTFGRALAELTAPHPTNWAGCLGATHNATALGDAIHDVISRKRGQPLAGILLFTDGANNSGMPPMVAATMAQQEGVPLYIYGVGMKTPKDVSVTGLMAPELAFVNDEVPVVVRLRAQGVAGRTARLALMLGEQLMDSQSVTFSNDLEQTVTMKFTPREKGAFDLSVTASPFPDELVKDNNTRVQRLRVLDTKIKVLLVEQAPRWEFRYLQASLLRDRRVELKCVLLEGDPGIATGEASPYLEEFPSRKEDLFQYDLVILGDVDLQRFRAEQIELLSQFVGDFGGALLLVAGKRFNPQTYRKTPLEKLLPVELDPLATDAEAESATVPIQLELTPDGKASPMLRLSDDPDENLACWRSLPPIYWDARVGRAKPGAEVLLVDADDSKATRFGKMPVLATQQYGAGHTLFLGTDNTWRWRKNVGETYFTSFWGQVVQRMALLRLLGAQKRIQISANRQSYAPGERVSIYARVYSPNYEPVTTPTLKALVAPRTPNGSAPPVIEVILRALPDQPGMYRGEFLAPAPGPYAFYLERDPQTQLAFDVVEPKLEFTDIAMNESLLKEMAALSGGQFLTDADLARLASIIGRKTERVSSTTEIEVWSSPLYFLLLLLLASAEWILRKLWQLK